MTRALRTLCVSLAVTAVIACGSSTSGPATAAPPTFELALDPGEPPVTVTAAIPAAWQPRFEARRADWKVPALDGPSMVSLAALSWSDPPAERMAKTIRMQFGDVAEQAKAQREELSGGRVWMQAREDGGRVHARMFVPFERGVVMGIAMIDDPDGKQLAAIRAVWETLQIVAPAAAAAPAAPAP